VNIMYIQGDYPRGFSTKALHNYECINQK
jgi:hypothetical protein